MVWYFAPMSTMTSSGQSFQGAGRNGLKGLIARSPPSRLLNLHALRRSPPKEPGYLSRPFFIQPILNRAIIVKHNMRRGEESLDGTRQLNALKMLFPLDVSNISFGARTLFASQCDLESIFQNTFDSMPPATERDLKLISLLEQTPTLDPFVLQEIAKQYGFDVSPCYFTPNQQVLSHQTAIVVSEINPILELFDSQFPKTLGVAPHLTEMISGKHQSCPKSQYITTGKFERESKLSDYFFNWKVVLFYRLRLKELGSTARQLMISLERLRPNVGSCQTTPLIERGRRRVFDALATAMSEAQTIAEDYDLLHYAVLRTARPDLFRALLRQSKSYVSALGARISRLDDALGFWSAYAPGGPNGVETYTLENFMESLDRHIASDLPLPKFVRTTARLGLGDRTTSALVTSRLRLDLPD